MGAKTPDSGAAAGGKGGLMKSAPVSVLAPVALVLAFGFENTGATRIRLLGSEITLPLWAALLATGLIGALGGAYFVKRRGQ